jgi:undecaprenyl diphosphate synthase
MMTSEPLNGLHVAIIMDGNGRWAAQRGLSRVAGHRAGVAAVRRVVERAVDTDVSRLTLYAFSSDNWRRPASEVQSIFWLLRAFLRLEAQRLRQRGVRLRVIGRRDRLAKSVLREIDNAEHATASGHRLDLRVAIDYSSRDAITNVAAGMMAGISNEGPTSPDSLDTLLKKAMTEQYGDVDLLIRTGGEKRLSDFLLWECAYAELLFTDRMWPDFDGADLDDALNEFRRRERRFGGLPAIALSQTVLPNGHLDALTSH